LTEREHREEAAAEGVAESIIIDTRGIPSAQGFGNALLTTRKTMRIERLIGPEVDD
jgi:hypothetical protein